MRSAQDLRQSGRLREARDLAASCAKTAACGYAVQKDCARTVTELDEAIPRVAPVVTDDGGQPIVDLQVTLDGQSLGSGLDGRAITVDPGLHEFSFRNDHGVVIARKVLVVEGQRGPLPIAIHAVSAATRSSSDATPAPVADDSKAKPPAEEHKSTEAESAPAAATEETSPDRPKRGHSALPYVIGGVGVLGLGAGALFTVWGRKDNDALSQCSPHCLQSNVDHVRTMYVAADISFGVGVVGLGVATALFIIDHSSEATPPPRSAWAFDVVPGPSGAVASVSGAF
jgi:hypothetical protein